MNAAELAIVRDWLKKSSGAMTQDEIADAIVAAGFKMDRTRYGRYATGRLPIGRQVYANLVAFWKARGVDAPDLNPPPVEKPVDPMERIALALERIGDKLDLLRADMAGQSGAVVGEVRTLAEQLTESLSGMRGAS